MPITCLNSGCYRKFDDLEEYHRHLLDHELDEGAAFSPGPVRGGTFG